MNRHIIYSPILSWRFNLKKAKGSILYTSDNKKLVDFTSGWNVANLGWNNPEITEAIIKQARNNQYVPMWASDDTQEILAEKLINSLPPGINSIGRATGGTEANEEALKIARVYTHKRIIVGFRNSYHGQSFGTMSIGHPSKDVEMISPMVDDFIQIDFPEVNLSKNQKSELSKFSLTLESILAKGNVAAVVCEAGIITGWGDTRIAVEGFLPTIRQLTKRHKALMILDEVGTGFSRCGCLFAMNLTKVTPDIVTLAKALSNGSSAIGCMVTKSEIANTASSESNFTSTFGWTPIACAAALKTLEIHKRDKIWEKANIDGNYLLSTLKTELNNNNLIKGLKGKGMIVGISTVDKNITNKIVINSFESGLHIVSDGNKNIQLMPPLTINRKELDTGIEILIKIVKNCQKSV